MRPTKAGGKLTLGDSTSSFSLLVLFIDQILLSNQSRLQTTLCPHLDLQRVFTTALRSVRA